MECQLLDELARDYNRKKNFVLEVTCLQGSCWLFSSASEVQYSHLYHSRKCPQRNEYFYFFIFPPTLAHGHFSMPAALSNVCIWACNLVWFGTSKFYRNPTVFWQQHSCQAAGSFDLSSDCKWKFHLTPEYLRSSEQSDSWLPLPPSQTWAQLSNSTMDDYASSSVWRTINRLK